MGVYTAGKDDCMTGTANYSGPCTLLTRFSLHQQLPSGILTITSKHIIKLRYDESSLPLLLPRRKRMPSGAQPPIFVLLVNSLLGINIFNDIKHAFLSIDLDFSYPYTSILSHFSTACHFQLSSQPYKWHQGRIFGPRLLSSLALE